MNVGEALEALERMESEMGEINAMLEPMAKKNLGRRDEPAWCAWAISGGLELSIGRLRGWIQLAIKDVT
jgi:hypothetical protein